MKRRAKGKSFAWIFILMFVFSGLSGGIVAHEVKLNEIQENALAELESNKGNYDENTILLNNTSKKRAEE